MTLGVLFKLTNMIKKNIWIHNILSCIKKFANLDYQKRAWVQCEIHWPCDFGEIMCSLFDDSGIEDFIANANALGLSRKQKHRLSKFVLALDRYADKADIYFPRSPPKIDSAKVLSDPEWHKIQKMAQKVLDAFEDMKYDPHNREDWLNYILSGIAKYSDIADQRKMWVDQSEMFFYTPRDLYDLLFMYADFDSFMDECVQGIGLKERQVEALKKFYAQIQITPFKTAEYEGILDDPKWQKLQMTSKETLEAFPKG